MNLPDIYFSKFSKQVYKYYLKGAYRAFLEVRIKIQGVLKNNYDDVSFGNIFLLYKNINHGIDLKLCIIYNYFKSIY
jgi:hypothetical protein